MDYQDLHIRNLEIPINDMLLEMKLIALGVCDFYVIMGMDWLSTYRALVDCFTKKVVFRKPGFSELEFVCDLSYKSKEVTIQGL